MMSSDQTAQTRKLQKVGGSTYTVSIPKHWACDQGLEAGTDVHLYAHDDGSLVVRSREHDGGALERVAAEVDGTGNDAEAGSATVERPLKAAYAAGFEEIELVSPDGFTATQSRTVTSLAKTLVGAEVVETDDDRILVRNLLDPGDVSVQQSLIQLQFVTLSMHRAATAAVTSADTATHVPGRDDEADRLFAMITRHFERSLTDFSEVDRLGVDRPALFEYYATARQLERVGDHAVTVAEVAEQLDEPVGGDVGEAFETVADGAREVVENATDAVIGEGSLATAERTLDRRDKVVADAEAVDRTLFERRPPDAYHLTGALDAIVRTAECGGNVAELAVQSALRRQA